VFSFGVVLLELLCARQPIGNSLEDHSEWNLADKVRNTLQAGDIESILDPVVMSCQPNMDSVWKVAELAIQSVEPKGVHRPFMRDVVRELREAIVLEAGHSHASYSSGQSSNFVNTARPAQHGRDYSNVSDPSVTFDEYAMGPQVR